MKKLATLLALTPSLAVAHGGHVDMSVVAHDTYHVGPWIGVGLIAAAVVLARIRERDE